MVPGIKTPLHAERRVRCINKPTNQPTNLAFARTFGVILRIGGLLTAALRKCRRGARVNDTPAQGLNGPGENRGEYVIRLVWPYSIERSKEG